jgi:hypothetical protein
MPLSKPPPAPLTTPPMVTVTFEVAVSWICPLAFMLATTFSPLVR